MNDLERERATREKLEAEVERLRYDLRRSVGAVAQLAERAGMIDGERGAPPAVETVDELQEVVDHLITVVEKPQERLLEMLDERREDAASQAGYIAQDLAELLYRKQRAYGDSGRIANGLWEARLAQYLTPDGAHYLLPRGLMRHLPRITRVDDRINRLVSNPDGDLLGESPWRDMAGDAIIGALNAESPAGGPEPRRRPNRAGDGNPRGPSAGPGANPDEYVLRAMQPPAEPTIFLDFDLHGERLSAQAGSDLHRWAMERQLPPWTDAAEARKREAVGPHPSALRLWNEDAPPPAGEAFSPVHPDDVELL